MKPKLPPDEHVRIEGKLPTVGWGPFKYQWYSICSGHIYHDVNCERCMAGSWINCWLHEVSSFVFKHDPDLWRWWVNRPNLTTAAKLLIKKALEK